MIIILKSYLISANFSSMFKSKGKEDKIRLMSFQRMCFIVFSGEKDKYMDKGKIKVLIDYLKIFIKDEKTHYSILIMVFFCLRIMFLRISHCNINEFLQNIWPILLNLLIQIFSPNYKYFDFLDLKLASLKLLETICACKIQDIYYFYWIFFIDYNNISLNNLEEISEKKYNLTFISPFKFLPTIGNIINDNKYINFNNIFNNDINNNVNYNFELIMKNNKLETNEELIELSIKLNDYLNKIKFYENNDKNIIEKMIIQDFISMNEFIIELK